MSINKDINRTMNTDDLESNMSYSAFLDDVHTEYTVEKRQMRKKRRSGINFFQDVENPIFIKKEDYESDITSDGAVLLKEFGDSDMRNNVNTSGLDIANELDTMSGLNAIADISIDTKKGKNMSDSELEDILMREMREYSKGNKIDRMGKEKEKETDDNKRNTSFSQDYRGSRTITKWVNDDSVDKCYGCQTYFTYFSRKHHCRVCGRIFCQSCSKYSTTLPLDIIKNIPSKPETYTDMVFGNSNIEKVRTCSECFKYVSNIIRIRKIIKVFEICGFNLIELTYLSDFSEDWKKAAEFCINRFREIQYKLSIEEITPIERKYIWVNRYLLSSHSRWMVMLLKCCDMDKESNITDLKKIISFNKNSTKIGKKISCWDMRCNRFCSEDIQLGDMLDIIRFNKNIPIISEFIIECLNSIKGDVLLDYLPFFVVNAINNTYMIGVLLDKFRGEFTFITHLYWCVKTFIQDMNIRRNSAIQILRFIKQKESSEFSKRFKIMITNERINMNWIKLQNSNTNTNNIVIPICPELNFDSVDVDNIRVIQSNSRPVIIPFIGNNKKKPIMYKEDDIRKDYVILGIINIIHKLLQDELAEDIPIVKYRVMPTSEKTGYIEIVENAKNIYQIIQKDSIQNYILNHNSTSTVSDIKDRFIKSTALYCVISYLFGFGDRHLENIMISESGLLFHIDFGYILGQDPKYTSNKYLRVTPEIVNVIGGQDTENYVKFSGICTKIYTCLRRHVNLFSNLLSVIELIDPSITSDIIKNEIFDRFEVGENNIEAAAHMDLKVRKDSGSFDYMIIDFLHRSKDTSLFKGLSYVTNSIMDTFYKK